MHCLFSSNLLYFLRILRITFFSICFSSCLSLALSLLHLHFLFSEIVYLCGFFLVRMKKFIFFLCLFVLYLFLLVRVTLYLFWYIQHFSCIYFPRSLLLFHFYFFFLFLFLKNNFCQKFIIIIFHFMDHKNDIVKPLRWKYMLDFFVVVSLFVLLFIFVFWNEDELSIKGEWRTVNGW